MRVNKEDNKMHKKCECTIRNYDEDGFKVIETPHIDSFWATFTEPKISTTDFLYPKYQLHSLETENNIS